MWWKILILLNCLKLIKADCVWYDKCGDDPDYGDGLHGLNCVYNGPPIKINDSEVRILLQEACPHLVDQNEFCCSKGQIQTFIEQNELPTKVLGRCPTCLYNFKRVFCDMMCDPNQSKFLKASKIITKPGTDIEMVKVLDYHVSESYAKKVYESCVDVVNPSTSGSVMDLLCGPWGGALCSPQRLLDYLGSISNGYAPFQINYFLHSEDESNDTGFEPHNPPVVPCHLEPIKGLGSCSCTDCETSCEPPDFSVYQKSNDKWIEYWQIIVIAVFVSGIIIAALFMVFAKLIWSQNNVVFVQGQKENQTEPPIETIEENLGAKMDMLMTSGFTKIAKISAFDS